MSMIVPTVTVGEPHGYREQVELAARLSPIIHIDLMDGDFTATKSINPVQVWWPDTVTRADIHLMFRKPAEHIETLVSLKPYLVILHAESEGDLIAITKHLQKFDIKVGVALLQGSTVESLKELIEAVDHVLIFSGNLGDFGGKVDLDLLAKVQSIRSINSRLEIGWDGGANESNVAALSKGGVDIINVGGAIQRADNPENAYATLVAKLPTI